MVAPWVKQVLPVPHWEPDPAPVEAVDTLEEPAQEKAVATKKAPARKRTTRKSKA